MAGGPLRLPIFTTTHGSIPGNVHLEYLEGMCAHRKDANPMKAHAFFIHTPRRPAPVPRGSYCCWPLSVLLQTLRACARVHVCICLCMNAVYGHMCVHSHVCMLQIQFEQWKLRFLFSSLPPLCLLTGTQIFLTTFLTP